VSLDGGNNEEQGEEERSGFREVEGKIFIVLANRERTLKKASGIRRTSGGNRLLADEHLGGGAATASGDKTTGLTRLRTMSAAASVAYRRYSAHRMRRIRLIERGSAWRHL